MMKICFLMLSWTILTSSFCPDVVNLLRSPVLVLQNSSSLVQLQNLSMSIANVEALHEFSEKYWSYLLVCNSTTELGFFLKALSGKPSFNSKAIVVVIFKGKDEEVPELFALFWQYFLSDAIVVTKGCTSYTYYPISKGFCNYIHPERANLASFSWESFAEKFTNCTLRVYALKQVPYIFEQGFDINAGFEVVILRMIVKLLGFKLVALNISELTKDAPNVDPYTLAFGQLYKKQADLVCGGIAFHVKLICAFDYTKMFSITGLRFFVPYAKPLQPWKNIMYIFDNIVWTLLGLSLLLLTCSWYILNKKNLPFSEALVYNFGILVNIGCKEPKFVKLKMIFLLSAFTSLIFCNAFQGLMVANLYKPLFQPQIATNEDLVDSGFLFGGFETSRKYFQAEETYADSYIYNNFINCSFDAEECFHRLVNEGDFALLKSEKYMYYWVSLNKTQRVFMLPLSFVTYMTYYLNKGSPYRDRIDQTILKLFANGMIRRWDVYDRLPKIEHFVPKSTPITLNHVLLVVFLYLAGNAMAILVFLGEICTKREKELMTLSD